LANKDVLDVTHAEGAIDCDIHPALPSVKMLLDHLEPYWREHILRRGLERDSSRRWPSRPRRR
jgi:hypothetical protein